MPVIVSGGTATSGAQVSDQSGTAEPKPTPPRIGIDVRNQAEYTQAVQKYKADLAAWEARQAQARTAQQQQASQVPGADRLNQRYDNLFPVSYTHLTLPTKA